MPLTHDQATELTKQLLDSHEAWQQQAVLSQTNEAIAYDKLKEVQDKLIELTTAIAAQQAMIQELTNKLASK